MSSSRGFNPRPQPSQSSPQCAGRQHPTIRPNALPIHPHVNIYRAQGSNGGMGPNLYSTGRFALPGNTMAPLYRPSDVQSVNNKNVPPMTPNGAAPNYRQQLHDALLMRPPPMGIMSALQKIGKGSFFGISDGVAFNDPYIKGSAMDVASTPQQNSSESIKQLMARNAHTVQSYRNTPKAPTPTFGTGPPESSLCRNDDLGVNFSRQGVVVAPMRSFPTQTMKGVSVQNQSQSFLPMFRSTDHAITGEQLNQLSISTSASTSQEKMNGTSNGTRQEKLSQLERTFNGVDLITEEIDRDEQLANESELAQAWNRCHFGMLGILKAFRNPTVHLAFIGVDPPSFGLDLDSKRCLHETFGYPWESADTKDSLDVSCIAIPSSFRNPWKIAAPNDIKCYEICDLDTLFYSFYCMPQSVHQGLAALELTCRGWQYHPQSQKWICTLQSAAENEEPKFELFNFNTWSKEVVQNIRSSELLSNDTLLRAVDATFKQHRISQQIHSNDEPDSTQPLDSLNKEDGIITEAAGNFAAEGGLTKSADTPHSSTVADP